MGFAKLEKASLSNKFLFYQQHPPLKVLKRGITGHGQGSSMGTFDFKR